MQRARGEDRGLAWPGGHTGPSPRRGRAHPDGRARAHARAHTCTLAHAARPAWTTHCSFDAPAAVPPSCLLCCSTARSPCVRTPMQTRVAPHTGGRTKQGHRTSPKHGSVSRDPRTTTGHTLRVLQSRVCPWPGSAPTSQRSFPHAPCSPQAQSRASVPWATACPASEALHVPEKVSGGLACRPRGGELRPLRSESTALPGSRRRESPGVAEGRRGSPGVAEGTGRGRVNISVGQELRASEAAMCPGRTRQPLLPPGRLPPPPAPPPAHAAPLGRAWAKTPGTRDPRSCAARSPDGPGKQEAPATGTTSPRTKGTAGPSAQSSLLPHTPSDTATPALQTGTSEDGSLQAVGTAL